MVRFSRKDVDYNIVLGFLEEFGVCAPSIIDARFMKDKRGGKALDSFHAKYTSLTWHPQTMPVSSPDTELYGLGRFVSCN